MYLLPRLKKLRTVMKKAKRTADAFREEEAHVEADRVLKETILLLGIELRNHGMGKEYDVCMEICNIFQEMRKWYA